MEQVPEPARTEPPRRALIAGAGGRLGEALLAATLVSARYHEVLVLTNGSLPSTTRGLTPLPLATYLAPDVTAASKAATPLAAQPDASAHFRSGANAGVRVETELYLCTADREDPSARAPNRRDAIYASVEDVETVRAIAAAAARYGVSRLLLLAPLAAWQQVSAASRLLPDGLEHELARLAIPTIVVLRPVTEHAVELRTQREGNAPEAGTHSRTAAPPPGRLARFARFYLSQLRFMLPSAAQPLRATELARVALAVMAESDRPGLTVVPPDRIRHHAETAASTAPVRSAPPDTAGNRP